MNQNEIAEEDDYDSEEDFDQGYQGDHLTQPIGKQPIEVTMQAVGLGDLSGIQADGLGQQMLAEQQQLQGFNPE